MVEILQAGAELDRAVAEAIGLRELHEVVVGGYVYGTFQPSVDLNAAFAAAELAFDSRLPPPEGAVKIFQERRRWIVERVTDAEGNATGYRGALEVFDDEDYYEHYWREEVEAFANTASLAICAAILELAKGV